MDRLNGWAELMQGFGDRGKWRETDIIHPFAVQAADRDVADAATRSEPARGCAEGGRGRGWGRR